MRIYLDDTRQPEDTYPGEDWTLARNRTEFQALVAEAVNKGEELIISFDHDIHELYSGMDCAKWLVKQRVVPDEVRVHSANPVGAENIRLFMSNWMNHMK
jgi:hypothetical protein